jgi:hypothetical protein
VTTHNGGCHCGAVKFEIDAPANLQASVCNCSICSMAGFVHLFVSRDNFRLLTPLSEMTTYTFNTGTAKHMFCKHCGLKSYYVPRSHPDGLSINVNCIDPVTIQSIEKSDFDGRNWEQNIDSLSPISD